GIGAYLTLSIQVKPARLSPYLTRNGWNRIFSACRDFREEFFYTRFLVVNKDGKPPCILVRRTFRFSSFHYIRVSITVERPGNQNSKIENCNGGMNMTDQIEYDPNE